MLLGTLLVLIVVSSITALTNSGPILLDGEDCIAYHQENYMSSTSRLNYLGQAQPGEELEFSIRIFKTTSSMEFNATVELINFPDNLTLLNGASQQIKSTMDESGFVVTWIISADTVGNFTFDIRSTMEIKYTRYHPTYVATYEYWYTGSFEVSENIIEPAYIDGETPEEPKFVAPLTWEKLTGQILGFLAVVFVYLSIQLAIPERKAKIRKITGWTAGTMKDIHCDLGYLAIGAIVLHNILLSRTIWGLYFTWFEFYPTFHVLQDGGNVLTWGLDLAVWGSLIFIIATIAGAFFKQIAKKYGYKLAIFSQQISYLALIFSVIHAALNGTWTGNYVILLILQIFMMLEVIITRYVAYVHVYDKKLQIRLDETKAQELEMSAGSQE